LEAGLLSDFDTGHLNWKVIQNTFQTRKRGILGEASYKKTAVLIPLIQTDQGLSILFEKRANTLRRQAGEICFPGGHMEPSDGDPRQTALRETSEELQIPQGAIHILGELDIVVTHAQMIIYPFVGRIEHAQPIQANPFEVEYVFTVPINRLLKMEPLRHDVAVSVQPDDSFPFHLIPGGKQYAWRIGKVPQLFYEIDSHVIWGLTAKILHHFLECIQQRDHF
jgi:coenzyme A diphosphatase NUDT7